MNAVRFIARDAADAVTQIRSKLGTEAVVLSVAQLPVAGLSRLWGRPRLEVLAHLPEPPPVAPKSDAPLLNVTDEPVGQSPIPKNGAANSPSPETDPEFAGAGTAPGGRWRSGAVLRQMGLQPLHIEKVIDRVRASHGEEPPASFAQEFALVRSALTSFWRPARRNAASVASVDVFIGPPGSGKTTVLCKWLAKTVLADGRRARAWRLDARSANFPGLLDSYGEILGVPVEREWKGIQAPAGLDAGFVDFPGVDPRDTAGLEQLHERLRAIPDAQVHLVLNAAYDVVVTLAQARAFAALPVSDLIFTHLDEESRRGKLWNFVLGTNFTIRSLSGGQNIPGDFSDAAPELLISAPNRN
jgi:flagellar biosynthesis protein FlhF